MEYTVEAVAELLGTTTETVRRWIREEKLKSTCLSNRQGHRIQEADLKTFLQSSKKYAKAGGLIVASSAASTLASAAVSMILPLATIGAGFGLAKEVSKQGDTAKGSLDTLHTQILENQRLIAQLDEEIILFQQQIQLHESQKEVYQKQNDLFQKQIKLWQAHCNEEK
ncbi:helix-turn-helix domain-containing protein [Bengtsoniella intestinalis]|uniref:helix-turn-helix domain-containing protein n=1 Tax=Bengtsoniella intestinalis TaxID=3073143 RepID=UPI00391F8742